MCTVYTIETLPAPWMWTVWHSISISRHLVTSSPRLVSSRLVWFCLRFLSHDLTWVVFTSLRIHATLTARDFFLGYFYPSGPITCIIFQNHSRVFPVLAVANTGSCVGPYNKISHPAGCRFPCWVPMEYKYRLKDKQTWLVVWWFVNGLFWR